MKHFKPLKDFIKTMIEDNATTLRGEPGTSIISFVAKEVQSLFPYLISTNNGVSVVEAHNAYRLRSELTSEVVDEIIQRFFIMTNARRAKYQEEQNMLHKAYSIIDKRLAGINNMMQIAFFEADSGHSFTLAPSVYVSKRDAALMFNASTTDLDRRGEQSRIARYTRKTGNRVYFNLHALAMIYETRGAVNVTANEDGTTTVNFNHYYSSILGTLCAPEVDIVFCSGDVCVTSRSLSHVGKSLTDARRASGVNNVIQMPIAARISSSRQNEAETEPKPSVIDAQGGDSKNDVDFSVALGRAIVKQESRLSGVEKRNEEMFEIIKDIRRSVTGEREKNLEAALIQSRDVLLNHVAEIDRLLCGTQKVKAA